MRLLAVKFNHYRCLHDTPWIPLKELTVFIGENDSGKTAALDGIAIVLGHANPADDDIAFKPDGTTSDREDELSISARIQLNDEERVTSKLPVDGSLCSEVTIVASTANQTWSALGLVPVDPVLRVDVPTLNLSDLRAILSAKGQSSPGGTRKEPFVEAVDALVQAAPKVLSPQPISTFPPHRSYFEVIDFRNARDASVVMNQTLRALFTDLIRNNKYPSLSAVQDKINWELQSKANELSAFVKKYRSDVSDVVVNPRVDFSSGYRDAAIALTDTRGNPIPLQLRGQGLHAHLRLAAYEWSGPLLKAATSVTRVVLLDEPDTHLDYQAQRRLLGVIEDYTLRGQVLLATHSMNLINRVALDQIVHFELDSRGTSLPRTISAAPGDEAKEINRIGESLGIENATLFYERAFFLFEGDTELHALPVLFELWTGSKWYLDGVRFINGYNNEGAIIFARFLHANSRPVLALVDQDTTLNRGFKRQFSRTSLEGEARLPADRVMTIGPTCFELAFSTKTWARAIQSVTKSSFSTSRRRTLERLRTTDHRAFLKYLSDSSGGLSKVELGVALAATIKRNEIPQVLRDSFEAAQKLAAR